MAIGKQGKQFVRVEITSDKVKQMIEYFEKLIGWAEENCEVVPIKGALDIPRERKGPLTEMLGAAFLDTVLIIDWNVKTYEYSVKEFTLGCSSPICNLYPKKPKSSCKLFDIIAACD